MARKKSADYSGTVNRQYRELMQHCKVTLDSMERELPAARENLGEALKERGVSRRDFLKWAGVTTTALCLPPMFKPLVARAAESFSRLPVVWLNLSECTGCSEALLRSTYPNVDDILLDTISLEYHETIMAASGHQAEKCLHDCMEKFPGKYVCVIEGAIPVAMGGKFLTIGAENQTGLEIARKVTSKAMATICMGTCACFGGVPAAKPNPTNALGVGDALGITTVNIAGCPPNPVNFVGTLLHFLMFGALPPLDSLGRPVWAYGKRIHDFCERRPHYDAGEYVEEWGDDAAKKGWCLYKMGCKGPYTFANCSKVRFNAGVSWPVMAGHGCIGCTEPAFWDSMAPFEKPIAEKNVIGGEYTVDKIGLGLLGATAAGVALHGLASAIKGHKPEDKE